MTTITLIRHGQANTEARTEAEYDRLSPLGHQQAAWLGAHMNDTGEHIERVYCGTLRRHNETAQSMQADSHAEIVQDERLNEIEYFTLAQLMLAQHGTAIPDDREGFVTHLPLLFKTWQEGGIKDAPETFQSFETRVSDAIADISNGRGPALVVTSGGLIGMVARQVMNLDLTAMSLACLAIMNTSVHRLHRVGPVMALTQFNAVPHLEKRDRHYAQTHL
jgi:broad specificity phosphatase PhoE